jgi:hypothetical protein
MIQAHKNGRRGNRLRHVPYNFIVPFSPLCEGIPNFALMLREFRLRAYSQQGGVRL